MPAPDPLHVPEDVASLIIDVLGAATPTTRRARALQTAHLRTCALIGRSFLYRARHYLYREVHLHNRKAIALFSKTVADSAELAGLVRVLDFSLARPCDLRMDGIDHNIMTPSKDVPELLQAVDQMVNLDTLRITCISNLMVLLIGLLYTFGYSRTLRVLVLRGLHLTDLAQFREGLRAYTGLRVLSILDCSFDNIRYPTYLQTTFCPQVEELAMCLNSRGGDVVLQFAPATLAKLTLWPFYEERENFQSISKFVKLKSLTLTCLTLKWAMSVLIQVSAAAELVELSLCHVSQDPVPEVVLEQLSEINLDGLLTRRPFATLNRFTYTIVCYDGMIDLETWSQAVEVRLPQSHARGILQCAVKGWRNARMGYDGTWTQ